MSIAKCYSAHLSGLSMNVVTVEVDISNGLNSLSVVGLGDRAVEESKDRVSAAIKNSGYTSPKQKNQKVVISLAPADTRKEGPVFDLAIAMAYLSAAGEIDCVADTEKVLLLGELSLEGKLRKVCGILPIICQAKKCGFGSAIIPADNAGEASLGCDMDIYCAQDLNQAISFLSGKSDLPKAVCDKESSAADHTGVIVDFSSIRGNESAKRGLEIAAAGFHNVIMCGPPGTGKTMLARGFSGILPPLSREESIEVTSIHSAAGTLDRPVLIEPPFRSPHHTASYAALVGGGTVPRPGEITLAHRGILFLDEFPEFDSDAIEALRQPLEDGCVTIARVRGSVRFPARCILLAAMNPCPCGKRDIGGCTCKPHEIRSYERRLSGPIVDRIDIWIDVSKVDYEKLSSMKLESESSSTIRDRIIKARQAQLDRLSKSKSDRRYNGEMLPDDILAANLDDGARDAIKKGAERLGLSGRAFHRVIKVSRTIADIAGEETVRAPHILEALRYRQRVNDTKTDRQKDSELLVSRSAGEVR